MHEEEQTLGLNKDEIAFYYALSTDEVVKDFNVRTQAQAKMRSVIRRLLKKYDYPPDQAKDALNIVMKQVELMCSNEADSYDGVVN